MKQNLVARLAAVLLGLFAISTTALAFEDVGNGVSVKAQSSKAQAGKAIAASIDDDDDDESFFSGGSNPSVPTFKSTRETFASVDVVAVCRAVLAEASGSYNQRFYQGCQKAVSQRVIRRAAR